MLGPSFVRSALLVPSIAWSLSTAACSSSGPSSPTNHSFPASAYATVTSDQGTWSLEVRAAPDQPPVRGVDEVQIRVVEAGDGRAVDALSIVATPWMPAMGHGISVTPDVTAMGGGVYEITNVDFFMPGTWELRLTLHGATDDTATLRFDVQ